jgi:hypothetical protein
MPVADFTDGMFQVTIEMHAIAFGQGNLMIGKADPDLSREDKDDLLAGMLSWA